MHTKKSLINKKIHRHGQSQKIKRLQRTKLKKNHLLLINENVKNRENF